MTVAIEEHIASAESPFQGIDIYQTSELGRALFLDGHIQLAEFDEHAYHESFAHVPLAAVPHAESALVIGGGDGGLLRELCRRESLREIHMVEIDRMVIDLCREHLPQLSAGAFDDPRVRLTIGDAFAFVKQTDARFDAIYIDATDVYEEEDGSLSENLFTDEFYADCARLLKPGGIAVTQADNPVFCPYSAEPLLQKFKAAFGNSDAYWCLVPSFGGYSAFVWGSSGAGPMPEGRTSLPGDLRYLNDLTYRLALSGVPFGELACRETP